MALIKILPADLPEAIRRARHEARCPVVLPLRLTSGSGEMIPAVILDLSVSGLLAVADVRSSPLLPPPRGSRFEGEFFVDELEVRQVELEVMRVEARDNYLVSLGCRFTGLPSPVSATLQTKVAALAILAGRKSR